VKLKIGIIDSGIGGFTILNSLLKTRNDVEVFYLADTKRIPYGNKKFKEIRSIAEEIATFFEDKNLDALLIACNTTNACALDILENNLRIPCFDLINSVSETVTKQIIGVLATQTTVKSSYYKIAMSSRKEDLKIFQQECPEFVSEIEIEKLNLDKLNYLSDLYLRPLINKNIEKIIFIWPEGIIPGISQDQLKEYKWLFENKFNENHLLAIGINSKEDENKTIKYFNTI